MNYSQEEAQVLIQEYEKNPSKETVEALAEKFRKSTKSVIGKLSREGVYRREVYRSKTGDVPITKVEIVTSIADMLMCEPDHLHGLDKAPKSSLKALEDALRGVSTGKEIIFQD
jgi:hypothetical protein